MLILPADGAYNLPFESISRKQNELSSPFTLVTKSLYSADRLCKIPSVVFG